MAGEFECEGEILREHLVGLLEGKSDLRRAKILSRKVANLKRQIEVSIKKEGLLILVLIPSLKPKPLQSGTLFCDPANIVVRCTENVLKNKTGMSAFYCACRVGAELQLHVPPYQFCGEITVTDIRQLNVISSDPEKEDEEDYDAWDVIAKTKFSIAPRSTTN